MFAVGRLGALGVTSSLLTPAWVLPGAAVDLDFMNNRYYGPGQIVCSRASVGYASDASGNWTSFASNAPRVTSLGLLVEDSRTNSIRNNAMQGAAVGTPGTMPNNWIVTVGNGLSSSVIAIGAENGIDYIDVRLFGTATATASAVIQFDSSIATANGDVWTGSAFFKLIAGSFANFTAATLNVEDHGGSGGGTSSVSFAGTTSAALSSQRLQVSRTVTGTANNETPTLVWAFNNGAALDLTLRIGWPQLERGAFATSPIRTTNAAATRAADSINLNNGPGLGAAITIFGKATPNAPASYSPNQNLIEIDDGLGDHDRMNLLRTGIQGQPFGYVGVAGASQYFQGVNSLWNGSLKLMLAAKASDQQVASGGSLASAHGTGSMPSGLVNILIGRSVFSEYFFGNIERLAIWPATRVSDALLQADTA